MVRAEFMAQVATPAGVTSPTAQEAPTVQAATQVGVTSPTVLAACTELVKMLEAAGNLTALGVHTAQAQMLVVRVNQMARVELTVIEPICNRPETSSGLLR